MKPGILTITIFTKDGCGKCSQAKEDLQDFLKYLEKTYLQKNEKINTIKVVVNDYVSLSDDRKNKIQTKIKKFNNNEEYNYYPKIFFNDEFIGGADILRGKIQELKKSEENLFDFLSNYLKIN